MNYISAVASTIIIFSSTGVLAQQKNELQNNWGGIYLGASIGGAFGKASPNVVTTQDTYFHTTDDDQLNPAASQDLRDDSFSTSLLLGYNVQQDGIVYGIETDVTYSKFSQSSSSSAIYLTNSQTFYLNQKVETNFLASIRGKLGYAVDNSLFYFSLGPSVANIKYHFDFRDPARTTSLSKTETKLGLSSTIGYEKKLSANWSIKAEYMISDFSNLDYGKSNLPGLNDGFTHELDLTRHFISVGFNYYF